jgi:uncharacterized phage protein gp47/JayE
VPQLFTFETRDASTIRDGILRVLSNGLYARGIANPNVTPGSDWYVFAQGVANELAVVEANATIKADAQMPDSSDGAELLRVCAIFGLSLQLAAGSSGPIILSSTAATPIATNAQLIDSNGLRYKLVTGGTYASGTALAIEAIDVGKATNHDEGDVLRWVTAPPFADEKVLVGVGGLRDGHDDEDYEGIRARLLAKLQSPPRSGNWQHVAEIAEGSTTAIQKAFVYPALQGGATVHIAVTATPSAVTRTRDVESSRMSGTVVPYVKGKLNERSEITTTTVTNVPTDVVFTISIPDAPTASPPGEGGGWLDGAPWPDRGATSKGTRVTSVTTTLVLVVDALIAPTPFVSQVAWLNPADWVVRTARVVAVTGTSGSYTVTLDTPFVGIVVGDCLWPAAQNAQVYVDAALAAFALMGPGEKTANASALNRGYRHPRPSTAWPYMLGSQMLGALDRSSAEISASQFLWRTDGTTDLTGPTGVLTPQVPGVVTGLPNQLIPGRIAFYPNL